MTKQWYQEHGFELGTYVDDAKIERAERDVFDAYIRPIIGAYPRVETRKLGTGLFASAYPSYGNTATLTQRGYGQYAVGIVRLTAGETFRKRTTEDFVACIKWLAQPYMPNVNIVCFEQADMTREAMEYKAVTDTEFVLVSSAGEFTDDTYEVVTSGSVPMDEYIERAVGNLAFLLLLQRTIFATRAGAKMKTGYNSQDASAWDKLQQEGISCHLTLETLRKQPYAIANAEVDDICKIYFKSNFFYQ